MTYSIETNLLAIFRHVLFSMISTGESEKVKKQNELDQALKECEKYLSYFIQQHNKVFLNILSIFYRVSL